MENKIDAFRGEYRFLSNFYPAQVEFEGTVYPSVENAYQASKTFNEDRRKLFLNATSGQAKKLGRDKDHIIRPDWDEVKIIIMTDLVRKKFNIPELKEKLLATEERYLEEGNSWHDVFWGICNGVGENHLGIILMKIREELKNGR